MPTLIFRTIAFTVALAAAGSVVWTATTEGYDGRSFVAGWFVGSVVTVLFVGAAMDVRAALARRQRTRPTGSVQEVLPGTTVPTVADYEAERQRRENR